MITEWLINVFAGLGSWFSSLLPDDEPPEFLSAISDLLAMITVSAQGLGAWVPWAYLGSVGAALLLLWVTLVSVKGVRWVWGLTPFSGGS